MRAECQHRDEHEQGEVARRRVGPHLRERFTKRRVWRRRWLGWLGALGLFGWLRPGRAALDPAQRDEREYQREHRHTQRDEHETLRRIRVEKVAGQRGLELVLDVTSGFVIYADKSLDMTNEVLAELNSATGSGR